MRTGSGTEHWALEWRDPPLPSCTEPYLAVTCPCAGFAYGEKGSMTLVRRRRGEPDQRLLLDTLFGEAPAGRDTTVIQRWPMPETDYASYDTADDTKLPDRVKRRPVTHVMAFGDYDHDGSATEFVLQIGVLPCGKREAVAVGVSRANPSLHALTTVGHPERPLVLEESVWKGLLHSTAVTAIEWECGDHGSDQQTVVRVAATPAGLDGERLTYACTDTGPGKLLSSERL